MTTPTTDVRAIQWKQLESALQHVTSAQFEYERGHVLEGRIWLDDVRRALGTLALTLADGPDAEGYARLFEGILTPPPSGERGVNDARP